MLPREDPGWFSGCRFYLPRRLESAVLRLAAFYNPGKPPVSFWGMGPLK
jgi:hypothetical protein